MDKKDNKGDHSKTNQKEGENISNENEEKNSEEKQTGAKDKQKFEHKHEKHLIKPGNRKYLSHYNYQDGWRRTRPLKPIAAEDRGPGPAVVNLPPTIGDHNHDPRRVKAPSYKMGERDYLPSNIYGPGPSGYDTRKITNKGRDECHAAKVGERCNELLPYQTPGPAAYGRGDSDAVIYPHSPAYSMRPRTQIHETLSAPAPDTYTLPGCLGPGKVPYAGGPAFSIRKLDKIEVPLQSPGPATYQLPSTNNIKQKPPAFSMGARTYLQMTGTVTPGPASNELHLVKFHKFSTPRFSFGIRHSPHKAFQTFAAGD